MKGSKTEGAGLFLLEKLGHDPLKLREAALRAPTVGSKSARETGARSPSLGDTPRDANLALEMLPPRVLKQVRF